MGQHFEFQVTSSAQGCRIDKTLAGFLPQYSRSFIQELLRAGHVLCQGHAVKPHYPLKLGQRIAVEIPEPKSLALIPKEMSLEILYEDPDLILLNKPAGIVVHPAPGHWEDTLVHGLLAHCQNLSSINGIYRPGIVHRLDKDTSGCLLVAKTDLAHPALSLQFKNRTVEKTYLCLVEGAWKLGSKKMTTPIGRNPMRRKKMMVTDSNRGREAVTWIRPLRVLSSFSLLEIQIKTGRTHQIRVHLAHLRHPVLGDTQYGHGQKVRGLPFSVARQMLHAWKISFAHPATHEKMDFVAPVPPDMQEILHFLEKEL